MDNKELDKLKYPIGKYAPPDPITDTDIQDYICVIEQLPEKLKYLVSDFSDEQYNTTYRPGGWTVKQVIHHIADSHLNAYTRFKLALTEDIPTIKPYFEDKWATLEDYKSTPVSISLTLIEALHSRWSILVKSMSNKDFEKSYFHPGHGKEFTLDETTGMYAWHCNHHYAHIEHLKKRMNW